MKKILTYTTLMTLLAVLTACDDVNFGNLFYTPCDVNARFEQSTIYNQKHPIDTLELHSEQYSFWVTSDLHFKNETTKPIEKFLVQANNGEAQFIVYNGDIYHGKEEYANYASEVLHNKSPLPSFYTAGNHDLYFGWNVYYDRFGTSTYTAIVKTPKDKDLLIFLESAAATLGNSQYQWLQEVLNKRGYYRHCFVFTHTNLFHQHVANGTFMPDEAHVLYRLFSDNKVTAVFTGHTHQEHEDTLLGVKYITTGALKNGEAGLVEVTAKDIAFEFIHF